ncbi:hypothetical protein PG987_010095 [Apiospora arundinis]
MSKPISFPIKWVGTKQKRAPRISDEDWTSRKARLQELYSTLTLAQLMDVVVDKDFNPTRSIENCGTSFTSSPDNLSSKKFKVDNEGTALQYQGLEFPPVPSASNSDRSANHICYLNNKEGDSDADIIPHSTPSSADFSIRTGGKTPAILSTTDATSTETEASSDIETHASAEFDDFHALLSLESIQSFEVDDFISAPSTDNQTSGTISEDIVYQRHLFKAVSLVRAARSFSPRMLTSLLGRVNQRHLFSAADYLDAVWNKKRAFDVYRVLFNLEQANNENIGKWQILSPIALSCARAAEAPWQRDIVKEVLLRRMTASSDHDISRSEGMLAHMLLGQMFVLDQQYTPAKDHFESIQKPIAGCDSADSSFDILAYLYHKGLGSGMTLQPGEQNCKDRSIKDQVRSVNHRDFVRFALNSRYSTLSPFLFGKIASDGPYPSTAVSQYVRSCIDWCSMSIDCIVPGASSFAAWLYEESSLPRTSRWEGTLALYNYLHRKWRREWHGDSQESTVRWSWMDDTRETLGISAAELLVACCDMVTHINTPRPADSSDPILRINLNKIQSGSDEDVVTIFLRNLYLRAVPFIWATGSTVIGMMKDAAESLVNRRFTVAGSDASFNSRRETVASFAESIDTMSDMMRDSLRISDTQERIVAFEFNTSE